jgi:chromosome partitioning protein
VVIDTPPGHERILRSAILAADVLVVPIAPSLIEVARLGPTFELAADVEPVHPVTVRVLLTRVRSRTRSSREARAFLVENEVPTLKSEVSMRERYALSYGTSPDDLGDYDDVLRELEVLDVLGV